MPHAPMTYAEKAHLIGTALTFLGGIGLSYDLLTGYPKRNVADIKIHQLEGLKSFLAHMRAAYLALPDPPNTPADKQKEIDELDKKFPTAPLEKEIKDLTEGQAQRSFIFGWMGMIAVLAGFSIDLVLALAPFFR